MPKLREEIDEKYKADLTKIYESDKKWYEDYEHFKSEMNLITDFKGTITKSDKNLYDYLNTYSNLCKRLEKIYIYAHLSSDFDANNSKYQDMVGKAYNLISEFDSLNSYANPELLSIDYSIIKKYISANDKLKDYSHFLENLYRYKAHFLTTKEEKILSDLSCVLNNCEKTYDFLVYTDMKFGSILDDDNNLVELTSSNYNNFLTSKNREVRKNAFIKNLTTYGNYKNTIASLFDTYIKTSTTLAKIKNYNSSIEASLFNDNIDVAIYDNLINSVNDNLSVLYKYFNLKIDVLKLDEMHLYDIYVGLTEESKIEYTYEEAKQIIKNALAVLGDDYINILSKAFSDRWIDVYNNIGKKTQAYSCGVYETNPYILINYENKITDVLALSHELGHSIHSYYSIKNNAYPNYEYTIFVAEVASLVNELLVIFYLLRNSNNDKEKLYVLNLLMDLFKTTIFRQTMFAEFERNLHKMCEEGKTLTSEVICDLYYNLNKKYFPNTMIVDEEIKYEWEKVTHFFDNFYVYKYAIGFSIACYIVDGILNNKENMKESYLKFLTLGGSMYPTDELKVVFVDATDSEVILSAIKMFDSVIDEFKKIYNK